MRYDRAMGEQILTRIPVEEKRRLLAVARDRRVSISELVREAVTDLVQRTAA